MPFCFCLTHFNPRACCWTTNLHFTLHLIQTRQNCITPWTCMVSTVFTWLVPNFQLKCPSSVPINLKYKLKAQMKSYIFHQSFQPILTLFFCLSIVLTVGTTKYTNCFVIILHILVLFPQIRYQRGIWRSGESGKHN